MYTQRLLGVSQMTPLSGWTDFCWPNWAITCNHTHWKWSCSTPSPWNQSKVPSQDVKERSARRVAWRDCWPLLWWWKVNSLFHSFSCKLPLTTFPFVDLTKLLSLFHCLFHSTNSFILGTLGAIALGALALLAGKALMTGLMALMLSAIVGLKALTSGGHKQTTYEIVAKPSYSHTHSASHEDHHGHGGGGHGGGGHTGYGSYGRSMSFELPEHLKAQ